MSREPVTRAPGTQASIVDRVRLAMPSRTQIIEYSPALVMAGWMLLTWDWEERGLWRIGIAVFAGFAFQAFLMIGLAISYVTSAHWLGTNSPEPESFSLRNPLVLGPLLLIVTLWMHNGYRDKRDERALVSCLESRAAMTLYRQKQGETNHGWDNWLSLEQGGMSWAVKSCRAEDAESRASNYEE